MSRDITKPTKWLCVQRRLRSAWASAQSDQSLCCPHEETWVLSYPLSTQRRFRSDWADAQADLRFRWAHSHFVGFVMSWLKYVCYGNIIEDCGLQRRTDDGGLLTYELRTQYNTEKTPSLLNQMDVHCSLLQAMTENYLILRHFFH